MIRLIIYMIGAVYAIKLFANINRLRIRNHQADAIRNRKILRLSGTKTLDMDNDYDFITFLIMNEYVDSNGAVLKNPSEKFIMCSKIMTEHNAHEHIEFLKAEKEKILEKIRKCNYITITKIMISIIVLSLFLFII